MAKYNLPTGWKHVNVDSVLKRVRKPVAIEPNCLYREIGIRSHGKGIFHKDGITGKSLGNKSVFWIEPDCFVVNIVFAWEQAVAKTTENERGMIASHRFPMYKPVVGKLDLDYILYFFKTPFGKHLLNLASPGGAGRNKTLGQEEFQKLTIPLPPYSEQRKIAEMLSTWDRAIVKTEHLIAYLQTRKKGLMQRMLTGQIRFIGFEDEWQEVPISKMGQVSSGGTPSTTEPDYWNGEIQWATPTDITKSETKYLTKTKDTISEKGLAKSSAVLLPPGSLLICTRATIGAAAINTVPMATNQGFKNLTPNENFEPEFILHLLKFYKHILVRYANGSTFLELSKKDFLKLRFIMPRRLEQKKIADILNTCDNEIELLQEKISLLKAQKKGLMQRLLTGQVRVKV